MTDPNVLLAIARNVAASIEFDFFNAEHRYIIGSLLYHGNELYEGQAVVFSSANVRDGRLVVISDLPTDDEELIQLFAALQRQIGERSIIAALWAHDGPVVCEWWGLAPKTITRTPITNDRKRFPS